jgi:hypothetical protein
MIHITSTFPTGSKVKRTLSLCPPFVHPRGRSRFYLHQGQNTMCKYCSLSTPGELSLLHNNAPYTTPFPQRPPKVAGIFGSWSEGAIIRLRCASDHARGILGIRPIRSRCGDVPRFWRGFTVLYRAPWLGRLMDGTDECTVWVLTCLMFV